MSDDYYKILEIEKNATPKEIKAAYYKLAKQWHPDKDAPDKAKAEEKFKEILKAYEVLSKPEKREIYDKFGEEGLNQNGHGIHPGNMDEILKNFMMGGFPGGMGFFTGMDDDEDSIPNVEFTKEVSLKILYTGGSITEHVDRFTLCSPCAGTGSADGIEHKCISCNGMDTRL